MRLQGENIIARNRNSKVEIISKKDKVYLRFEGKTIELNNDPILLRKMEAIKIRLPFAIWLNILSNKPKLLIT